MWSPMVVQKPGRGRPRGVLAGERAARRPRRAPARRPSARRAGAGPARACSAAAMSPTASTAGSELRIEASTQHGAVLDVEAGAGASSTAGRRRCPSTTRSAASTSPPASRHAPARLDALDLGAEADLDAGLAQQRRDELAGALAQALGLRALLGRDEDDVEAAAHERRRRLAGDEAGADDHRAGARLRRGAQAQGVVDRADRVQARDPRRPSHRRALRRRARGEHAGVVGQLLAALEVHRARLRGRARPRGVPRRSVTAWAANQGSSSSGRSRGLAPRRAGTPWSAAGAGRAGAARRR